MSSSLPDEVFAILLKVFRKNKNVKLSPANELMVLTVISICFRYAATVGLFIGSISGGGYLLRKASHWQPMEEIIRQKLSRSKQRELVAALLTVCAELHLVSILSKF
jgi:hypothetical protein